MKNLFIALGVAFAMASCGNSSSSETESTVDTTVVTPCVDTTASDSCCVDSVTTVDTTNAG
jgi:hypothetical protein